MMWSELYHFSVTKVIDKQLYHSVMLHITGKYLTSRRKSEIEQILKTISTLSDFADIVFLVEGRSA